MLIRHLASDESGTWRIVSFPTNSTSMSSQRRPSTIDDEFTIEDILAYPSRGDLHRRCPLSSSAPSRRFRTILPPVRFSRK